MIMVNLLVDQTTRVRKKMVRVEASSVGLVLVSVFVLLLGGLGAGWFYVNSQISKLQESRTRLQAEKARQGELKREIEEFDKLKKLLQDRIEVIEKLKELQTGPLLLLNHIIQSVPAESALWLNVLDQKGDKIRITGSALRSDAVPDFMSNLARSGFFKSVELELIEDERDAAKFSLVCASSRKPPTE